MAQSCSQALHSRHILTLPAHRVPEHRIGRLFCALGVLSCCYHHQDDGLSVSSYLMPNLQQLSTNFHCHHLPPTLSTDHPHQQRQIIEVDSSRIHIPRIVSSSLSPHSSQSEVTSSAFISLTHYFSSRPRCLLAPSDFVGPGAEIRYQAPTTTKLVAGTRPEWCASFPLAHIPRKKRFLVALFDAGVRFWSSGDDSWVECG
ncbi:hypothetical protein GALMADRAFT_1086704 [Galerina marginata CBS 339.88]|uniref:Uncharacterized protein n=1 Tax=Galerina marginata (strain CBS 339.88) TaxID=685588 RepID=A0A067SL47_GALM3|nr:hypothetical protein GALMADRAFT_1086704 [Galerina marginata CBS 339.88]